MVKVSTYLNFKGKTEEAFNLYKSVFGGDFVGVHRYGEMPPMPGMPALSDSDKKLIMHMSLKLPGGHQLMGTDVIGPKVPTFVSGTNFQISLEPDSRSEADRIFNALSKGGTVDMPMQDTFWGAYYGSFKDKYGIQWMINLENKS